MISFGNVHLSTIKSGKGDCIRVHYAGYSGTPRNIIVDSGPTSSAGEFRNLCKAIIRAGEAIDALIITHYDDDHIGGALRIIDIPISTLIFNAYNGRAQTSNLSAIQNQRLLNTSTAGEIRSRVLKGDSYIIDGAVLSFIAPDKDHLKEAEHKMRDVNLSAITDWNLSIKTLSAQGYPGTDNSISNRASIVFIFEYGETRILFCGDAAPESIIAGLPDNKRFSLVKLPHHGSIRNLSDELIDSLDTNKFLICADGTRHPNKQTIAKLARNGITIYSNYRWWTKMLLQEDKEYVERGYLTFLEA